MYLFRNSDRTYHVKNLLVFCAFAFIVPIIFFLIGTNLYASHLLREKVTASNHDTLKLYANQLDDKLGDLETYLSNIGASNLLIEEFLASQTYEDRLLFGYLLIHQLSDDLPLYDAVIDGLFLYDPTNEIFLNETSIVESISMQEMIQEQIYHFVSNSDQISLPISSQWMFSEIGGHYYLFCIYHLDGIYYGSWSNAERVLQTLVTVPIDGAQSILLLTSESQPLSSDPLFLEESIEWRSDFSDYYLTGDKETYVVIGETVQELDCQLIVLLSDASIQKGLSFFYLFFIVLTIVSFFLLLLFLHYTKREIASPLNKLSEAIRQLESENFAVSLPENEYSVEFRTVNQNFNHMVKEIRSLKIKVYEEQLQKQKAQLDFLRIQINPHFFINAMNVLYHYALLKNLEMVQNMTLSLVRHFRYTLYGDPMVTIREEIEFIQNYLHLQDLRNDGKSNIILDIEIPENLMDFEIPILLIQPFVENSIKYGESQIQKVLIQIEAHSPATDCIVIRIRDFGNGFPDSVLHCLRNGEPVFLKGKKRIGIDNVKSRLQILYGDRASLCFSNQEYGGAVVEICIYFHPD